MFGVFWSVGRSLRWESKNVGVSISVLLDMVIYGYYGGLSFEGMQMWRFDLLRW